MKAHLLTLQLVGGKRVTNGLKSQGVELISYGSFKVCLSTMAEQRREKFQILISS